MDNSVASVMQPFYDVIGLLLAFVNALAWICHREDHHPDLAIGFDRASVRFSTHSAGGLTERDLRLARLVDGLLAGDSAAG